MEALKVVVTGASGFMGAYVLQALSEYRNIEVIAVTRKEISGYCRVSDYSESPVGDVLIHLAENNDRAKVAKVGLKYQEEVLATLGVLLKKGYRRVVYSSSGVLYGDSVTQAHLTSDPIKIDDTYSYIKRLSELAVLKLPGGVVVRPSNIYGPRMSQNNVISNILRQIPGTGALKVFDTNPVRDFVWALDAAEGIVLLALGSFKKGNGKAIYNLGTGLGTSIGDLASMALQIAGQADRPVIAKQLSKIASNLLLDFSHTTSTCGWKPKTTLKQGLLHLLTNEK